MAEGRRPGAGHGKRGALACPHSCCGRVKARSLSGPCVTPGPLSPPLAAPPLLSRELSCGFSPAGPRLRPWQSSQWLGGSFWVSLACAILPSLLSSGPSTPSLQWPCSAKHAHRPAQASCWVSPFFPGGRSCGSQWRVCHPGTVGTSCSRSWFHLSPGWTGMAVTGLHVFDFNGHFLWGQIQRPRSLEESREVLRASKLQAPASLEAAGASRGPLGPARWRGLSRTRPAEGPGEKTCGGD